MEKFGEFFSFGEWGQVPLALTKLKLAVKILSSIIAPSCSFLLTSVTTNIRAQFLLLLNHCHSSLVFLVFGLLVCLFSNGKLWNITENNRYLKETKNIFLKEASVNCTPKIKL